MKTLLCLPVRVVLSRIRNTNRIHAYKPREGTWSLTHREKLALLAAFPVGKAVCSWRTYCFVSCTELWLKPPGRKANAHAQLASKYGSQGRSRSQYIDPGSYAEAGQPGEFPQSMHQLPLFFLPVTLLVAFSVGADRRKGVSEAVEW